MACRDFIKKDGQWTIASSTYTAGIMIPARTRQGLISGFQIRLDVPLKNEMIHRKGRSQIHLVFVCR